jgi:hypothetical protein
MLAIKYKNTKLIRQIDRLFHKRRCKSRHLRRDRTENIALLLCKQITILFNNMLHI